MAGAPRMSPQRRSSSAPMSWSTAGPGDWASTPIRTSAYSSGSPRVISLLPWRLVGPQLHP